MSLTKAQIRSLCGHVMPKDRTASQNAVHANFMAGMPRFKLTGNRVGPEPTKVCLWDAWANPQVVARTNNKIFDGFYQYTGSCVGAANGNVLFCLQAGDVHFRKLNNLVQIPFWPYNYGLGRSMSGDHGQGEGSFASAFLTSAKTGVLSASEQGLPGFKDNDMYNLDAQTEMKWSDGDSIAQNWKTLAKPHPVTLAAMLTSVSDVRLALTNGYPVSCAGMWGGLMQCEIKGTPPVLLNRHADEWSHNQSLHAFWDHPQLGPIYYWLNQWGLDVHGTDPSGAPRGGYWTLEKDVAWQIANDGELIAYNSMDAWLASTFSWVDVV